MKNVFFSRKFDCDEDAVKIAVLYFVMMYLLTSPKDKFVIKEYLDIMDGGQFNEYCWGRDIFFFTVESMKGNMLRVQKKGVGYHYYRLNGFPLVLQVWFYECCGYCKNILAYHRGSAIPRILNWHTYIIPSFKKLNSEILSLHASQVNILYFCCFWFIFFKIFIFLIYFFFVIFFIVEVE